jgi:hypothetical protein
LVLDVGEDGDDLGDLRDLEQFVEANLQARLAVAEYLQIEAPRVEAVAGVDPHSEVVILRVGVSS